MNEAPRQGCPVFSPGVEEGRKPRRRPRDSSAGRNPHDPDRVSHLPDRQSVRHPIGVVFNYDDQPLPGVIGTTCLNTRAKSRRSLRGFAPSGSVGRSIKRPSGRRDRTRRRGPHLSYNAQMRPPEKEATAPSRLREGRSPRRARPLQNGLSPKKHRFFGRDFAEYPRCKELRVRAKGVCLRT